MSLRTAFVFGTSLLVSALSASAEEIDAQSQEPAAFQYNPLNYIYIPDDSEYFGDRIASVMDLPLPGAQGDGIDGRLEFITSSNKEIEDPDTGEMTYGVLILGHIPERRELYNISLQCDLVNDEEFAGGFVSLLEQLPNAEVSFSESIFAFCGDAPVNVAEEDAPNAGFQTMHYMSESGAYLLEVVKESQRNPLSAEDFIPIENPLTIGAVGEVTFQAG